MTIFRRFYYDLSKTEMRYNFMHIYAVTSMNVPILQAGNIPVVLVVIFYVTHDSISRTEMQQTSLPCRSAFAHRRCRILRIDIQSI